MRVELEDGDIARQNKLSSLDAIFNSNLRILCLFLSSQKHPRSNASQNTRLLDFFEAKQYSFS
jgi:hypothetical protein